MVSGVLQTELQNAGLQPIDAASLSSFDQALRGRGEPTVADLLSAARGEGMARLVVARVEPAGERQLNYMGRVDVAYSARVTLTCYDTGSGRPTGPSASAIVEYTTLSVERATEKAVGPLIEAITEQVR